MATIGTFTKDSEIFTGTISTLALKAKATLQPVEGGEPSQPNYRVYTDGIEIGAAWNRLTPEHKSYLSVKLDDPSFSAPIYCRLVEISDGAYRLYWSR